MRIVLEPVIGMDIQCGCKGVQISVHDETQTSSVAPLDCDTEVAQWRLACRLASRAMDPPIMTDLDREVSGVVAEMVVRVEAWQSGRRAWSTDVGRPGVDPVALLASAVGRLGLAVALQVDVDRVNAITVQANVLRHDRGLNWAPRGGVRVMALP